jgi:hypothetical protein
MTVTASQTDTLSAPELGRFKDYLLSFNPSLGGQKPPTIPDLTDFPSLRPGAGEKPVKIVDSSLPKYPDLFFTDNVFPTDDPVYNDTGVASVTLVSSDVGSATFSVVLEDGTDFIVVVEGKSPEEAMALATQVAKIVAQMGPGQRKLIGEIHHILLTELNDPAVAEVSTIPNPDGAPEASSGSGGKETSRLFIKVDISSVIDPIQSEGDTPGDGPTAAVGYAIGVLSHELGHVVSLTTPDPNIITSFGEIWDQAANDDGEPVSKYGTKNREEDIAETYALWYRVRTGQITGNEAKVIQARFKHRFALLDSNPAAVATLYPQSSQGLTLGRGYNPISGIDPSDFFDPLLMRS